MSFLGFVAGYVHWVLVGGRAGWLWSAALSAGRRCAAGSLIFGKGHPEMVLVEYVDHYNLASPVDSRAYSPQDRLSDFPSVPVRAPVSRGGAGRGHGGGWSASRRRMMILLLRVGAALSTGANWAHWKREKVPGNAVRLS
jgi:hypothetical protein